VTDEQVPTDDDSKFREAYKAWLTEYLSAMPDAERNALFDRWGRERRRSEEERRRIQEENRGPFIDSRVLDWLKSNAALLSSAVIVVLAIMNLLLISRGNPTTTLGLLTAASPVTVLIGMVIAVLPTVLAMALPIVLVVDFFYVPRREGEKRNWRWGLYLSLAVLVLLFSPLRTLESGIAAGLVWYFLFRRRRERFSPTHYAWIFIISALVSVALALLIPSGSVWLPPENLTVPGRITAGYVVNDQGDWLTELELSSGKLERLKKSDIISRELCQANRDINSKQIIQLIRLERSPLYPRCQK
jgi:hypothetical protein